jgi:ribonuclease D
LVKYDCKNQRTSIPALRRKVRAIEKFPPRNQLLKNSMVADAVHVEPVSATEFPANREINRENRKIRPAKATRASLGAATMGLSGEISCEN